MTHIKICGITTIKDAVDASKLGVDMLGFVFYKKSKRYVEPGVVAQITNELTASVDRVGVFVDEEPDKVREIASTAGLTMLQFHGDETPEYCAAFKGSYKVIKAFRVKDRKSLAKAGEYDVDFYLLDTYAKDSAGGTGKMFDWKLLNDFEFLRPIILSGGLTPDNVSQAIEDVAPYGVDVSTGVEISPGKKDLNLMSKFVINVRKTG
jgi:phosphoribosylanthranilate isomerase